MQLKDVLGTEGLLHFQSNPELAEAVKVALSNYLDWKYLPWELFYYRQKDPSLPNYQQTAGCLPLVVEVSVNGKEVGTLYVYEALEMVLFEFKE